jgi:hypothetical protein
MNEVPRSGSSLRRRSKSPEKRHISSRRTASTSREAASASRGVGTSAARAAAPTQKEKSLQQLIIFGWITALLYFPSGLLHGVLGPIVYLRDLMLGLHVVLSTLWLAKKYQLKWVAAHSWVILITPALLLPAVLTHDYTMEALRTCKWSICWLDWIILGHLLRLNKEWGPWFKLLGAVTLTMMCVEMVAGFIEWQTGQYLFPTTWGETTVFGVSKGNDQVLEGKMRIHGLQRDVFSFANVMGMNAVAGMAYLTITRKQLHQVCAALWAASFGGMMLISGGRSALFGAFAAAIYTALLLTVPALARKYSRSYVATWLVIAIAMSFIGVGRFTDFVGGQVLAGSYVGDSDSAYMRDDYWVKMLADFVNEPLILVIGGPFASVIDSRIDVMFHWADNQLLWNTYHTGFAGSLAILFFFYKVLEPEPPENDRMARQALVLFLCFVLGEGIARESLTFMGCLPLFLLCGYDSAGEMLTRRGAPAASALRLVTRQTGGQR